MANNPAFARRHYELIAAQIKSEIISNLESERFCCISSLESLAQAFADSFASDNERFSRARFLSACGLD